MQKLNWSRVGRIHEENMDLTCGMQVHVPVNGQKYHSSRHKKIFYCYDEFSTCVVVV